MKCEYLLFNLIVVAGPIALSFDRRVHYVSRWLLASLASAIMMIPYIIWDAMVTGSHWWFNPKYILGVRLAGLPLGELFFFITVPFSCLFIWEIISFFVPTRRASQLYFIWMFSLVGLPIGIWCYRVGKEYTALVLIFGFCLVQNLLKDERRTSKRER